MGITGVFASQSWLCVCEWEGHGVGGSLHDLSILKASRDKSRTLKLMGRHRTWCAEMKCARGELHGWTTQLPHPVVEDAGVATGRQERELEAEGEVSVLRGCQSCSPHRQGHNQLRTFVSSPGSPRG